MDVLDVNLELPAVGGIVKKGFGWELKNSGESLSPEGNYSVLANDFMYAGGDNYDILAQYDPNAYITGIDWRQPVIDWILAQNSTPENPLDQSIEQLGY